MCSCPSFARGTHQLLNYLSALVLIMPCLPACLAYPWLKTERRPLESLKPPSRLSSVGPTSDLRLKVHPSPFLAGFRVQPADQFSTLLSYSCCARSSLLFPHCFYLLYPLTNAARYYVNLTEAPPAVVLVLLQASLEPLESFVKAHRQGFYDSSMRSE
jgi:hypothetical protein